MINRTSIILAVGLADVWRGGFGLLMRNLDC